MKQEIYVFESNLGGIHNTITAAYAKRYYGAISGHGAGLQGNSYAIPTKDGRLRPLPFSQIEVFIKRFITFVYLHSFKKSNYIFKITEIGKEVKEHNIEDISKIFEPLLDVKNVKLPHQFVKNILTPSSKDIKEHIPEEVLQHFQPISDPSNAALLSKFLGISKDKITKERKRHYKSIHAKKELKENIRILHRQGFNPYEIAENLHIYSTTVNRYLEEIVIEEEEQNILDNKLSNILLPSSQIRTNKHYKSDSDRKILEENIKTLYKEGFKQRQIAEALGIYQCTVSKYLKKTTLEEL